MIKYRTEYALDLFCFGKEIPPLFNDDFIAENPFIKEHYRGLYIDEKDPEYFSFRFFETSSLKDFDIYAEKINHQLQKNHHRFHPELRSCWTIGHFCKKATIPTKIHISAKTIHFLSSMGFDFDYSLYPSYTTQTSRKNKCILVSFTHQKLEKIINGLSKFTRVHGVKVLKQKSKHSQHRMEIIFYGENQYMLFKNCIKLLEKRYTSGEKPVKITIHYFAPYICPCFIIYLKTIRNLSRMNASLDLYCHPSGQISTKYKYGNYFNKILRELNREIALQTAPLNPHIHEEKLT